MHISPECCTRAVTCAISVRMIAWHMLQSCALFSNIFLAFGPLANCFVVKAQWNELRGRHKYGATSENQYAARRCSMITRLTRNSIGRGSSPLRNSNFWFGIRWKEVSFKRGSNGPYFVEKRFRLKEVLSLFSVNCE